MRLPELHPLQPARLTVKRGKKIKALDFRNPKTYEPGGRGVRIAPGAPLFLFCNVEAEAGEEKLLNRRV